MSSAKRLVLLGILVLMVVAVLGRIAANRAPVANQLKLKDGRVIQLAGMTEGQSHALDTGWRGKVSHYLPAQMKRLMGPDFRSSFGFGNPGLALWLMCFDPAAQGYQNSWLSTCEVLDEHGCQFPVRGWGSTGDGYYYADILNFPAYPRDAKKLTLRLYDMQGQVLAKFLFEHTPSSKKVEHWQPEAMPIVKTNGPLVLQLEGFATHTEPVYTIRNKGAWEKHWKPEQIYFEDATGNSGEALCRMIPAWKWKAIFFRTPDAPFAPDEIVTLTNITIPPAGQIVDHPVNGTIAGKSITNIAAAGPGRYDYSNGVLTASAAWKPGMGGGHGSSSSATVITEWRASDRTSLFLPTIPLPKDSKLIIRARRGEELIGATTFNGSSQTIGYHDLGANFPTGVVDLDIIVDKGYRFEAKVAPEVVFGKAKQEGD